MLQFCSYLLPFLLINTNSVFNAMLKYFLDHALGTIFSSTLPFLCLLRNVDGKVGERYLMEAINA